MPNDNLVSKIAAFQDYDEYRNMHWEGSFEDYLAIVKERPEVTRNAYQRLYDMIISHGISEYTDSRKKVVRYDFFSDPFHEGGDAVFGMDVTLMKLVKH